MNFDQNHMNWRRGEAMSGEDQWDVDWQRLKDAYYGDDDEYYSYGRVVPRLPPRGPGHVLALPKRHLVEQEFLTDVLVTALEGGSTYWTRVTGYKYVYRSGVGWTGRACPAVCAEGLGSNAYALVRDDEDDAASWSAVNPQTIATGLRRLDQTPPHSHPSRARLLAVWEEVRLAAKEGREPDMDAGDLDADDADLLLQMGLFGEVVYG